MAAFLNIIHLLPLTVSVSCHVHGTVPFGMKDGAHLPDGRDYGDLQVKPWDYRISYIRFIYSRDLKY